MKKLLAFTIAAILFVAFANIHVVESYSECASTPTDLIGDIPAYLYSLPDPVPYIVPATNTDLIAIEDCEEEQITICAQEDNRAEYHQSNQHIKKQNEKMYTIQMLDIDMNPITDLVVIGTIDDDGIVAWLDEFCMYVVIAPLQSQE